VLRQIFCGQHSYQALEGHSLGVEVQQFGVCMGAAHKGDVPSPRQRHILAKAPLAAQQGIVFTPCGVVLR
jgi:hypothetical protein